MYVSVDPGIIYVTCVDAMSSQEIKRPRFYQTWHVYDRKEHFPQTDMNTNNGSSLFIKGDE